ncbi:MAG: S-layer homology domain-containing protein, partial [Chloroflexia bacterium]
LALQPTDGKIVLAGYAPVGGINDFALARLNSDGSLDGSFGAGGKVNHDFGGGVAIARGVAVQADGRIVAGGTAYMGEPNSYDYALARYLSGEVATPTPTPNPTNTPGASPTACSVQFPDVPAGSTFYDYVRCLACKGIVSGYPDGTFGPNNLVTRGQLSKIVSNSAGYNEPHSEQSFEDVPVGSTFHLFIERLFSRSFISGYACGGAGEPCGIGNSPYFRPNANVTRGQTSKIVASARGLPAPPAGLWTFHDVPNTSTFWQWIEELASSGAITGYPCGGAGEPCVPPENRYYFRPATSVTRGQSAKIVSNTFFPDCQTPRNAARTQDK